MRLFAALGVFLFCLLPEIACAQEPTLPKPETQDPQSTATDAAAAKTTDTPAVPQLIPPTPNISTVPPPLLSQPTIPQLDEAFKQSPLSVATANAKHHQEWRELRNRVVFDPRVKQSLAAAEAARTDLEKRKLLRKHYELYFQLMSDLAPTPELKAYLNDRKNEQLAALPQPRVRPKPNG